MRLFAVLGAALALAACEPCPRVPEGRAWPHPAVVTTDLPPRPSGAVRLAVGGDSRMGFGTDQVGPTVLRWAFETAARAGASAFLYLGDMERTPPADAYFPRELARLDPRIAFCPVFGNHETLLLGAIGVLPEDLGPRRFARDYLDRCVARDRLPVIADRAEAGRLYYSVDLPGDVHFVALDNVSPALGFGEAQLSWLEADLATARARGQHIVVGMHKAPARTGVSRHSMDEDEAVNEPGRVARDSDDAIDLFARSGVELLLASHEHGYWEFATSTRRRPIRTFITGGLGAPLKTCAGPEHAFHHLLLLDVSKEGIEVTAVRRRDG